MIDWTPIAVNEKPLLGGNKLLPEYSAAVVGSSVVLRLYAARFFSFSMALTTVSFAAPEDAAAWIAANKVDLPYANQLSAASS
jgi:hypothetical protein